MCKLYGVALVRLAHIIANLFLFLGSLVLVCHGSVYLKQFQRYEAILDAINTQTVPLVSTIIGFILVSLSLFGFWAICWNGLGMIIVFIICVFAIGLGISIFGILLIQEITTEMYQDNLYFNNFLDKDDNMSFDGFKQFAIDNIQIDLNCCGITKEGWQYYTNISSLVTSKPNAPGNPEEKPKPSPETPKPATPEKPPTNKPPTKKPPKQKNQPENPENQQENPENPRRRNMGKRQIDSVLPKASTNLEFSNAEKSRKKRQIESLLANRNHHNIFKLLRNVISPLELKSPSNKYGVFVFPQSCCKDYDNVCLLDEIWGVNCIEPLELFGNNAYLTLAVLIMCLSVQCFFVSGTGFVLALAVRQFYYY